MSLQQFVVSESSSHKTLEKKKKKDLGYFFHLLQLAAASEHVSEDIMLSPTILRGSVGELLFLIRRQTAAGMTAADT